MTAESRRAVAPAGMLMPGWVQGTVRTRLAGRSRVWSAKFLAVQNEAAGAATQGFRRAVSSVGTAPFRWR
jgi:hypothetical protein